MPEYASLNFNLDEDINMLRELVRTFVQEQISPLAQELDANNAFPNQLWVQMGDMGLLGITAEEQYGGLNMGYLAHIAERKRKGSGLSLSHRSLLTCKAILVCFVLPDFDG